MERQTWIDVLRGMTMLLVIMGHCIGFTDNPINRMILCFHMVLFYFISGLTFNPSKYGLLKDGIKVKLSGIGLQYVCFSLMGIVLYYALVFLGLQENGKTVNLLTAFIGIFFPDGHWGALVTMGFWFVYDIIIIDLICLCIYYSFKTKNYYLLVLPGVYVACMSLANLDLILRQFVGLSFFIAGKLSMSKIQNIMSFRGSSFILLIVSLVTLGVLYYSSFCNIPIYMYKLEIGNVFIFVVNAVLGVSSLVALALFVRANGYLEWIGRNTLPILFSHFALQRFFYLIINIVFPKMKEMYGEYVWSTTPFWIATFIFLIFASSLFAYVMNKYFPSLIGKGWLKNKVSYLLN